MRPDYCPMVNEPCQSMCDTPCSVNKLKAHRTWVGLTPEDYYAMRPRVPYIVNDFTFADIAAIVEAKLKEKNT